MRALALLLVLVACGTADDGTGGYVLDGGNAGTPVRPGVRPLPSLQTDSGAGGQVEQGGAGGQVAQGGTGGTVVAGMGGTSTGGAGMGGSGGAPLQVPECKPPQVCEERAGHKYLFVALNVTTNTARLYCQMFGFTLVAIDDVAENEWLTQRGLALGFGIYTHIGLNDRAQRGAWVWDNGSPSTYRNWDVFYAGGTRDKPSQPDMRPGEHCALLGLTGSSAPGLWHDNFCGDGEPGVITNFICEDR